MRGVSKSNGTLEAPAGSRYSSLRNLRQHQQVLEGEERDGR